MWNSLTTALLIPLFALPFLITAEQELSIENELSVEKELNNENIDDQYEPELTDDIEFLPGPRIVGGRNAVQNQFPYQVSVRLRGSHTCGGAIISRNYIVTAAHCVLNERNSRYAASQLSIRAGSNQLNSGGVVVSVAEVKPHPNYRNIVNDIALLRLTNPLTLSNSIKSIALATSDAPAGSAVVVSGWGRIRAGGPLPSQLQYNILTALSNAECRRRIRNNPSSILCLAHSSGNGVCQGDSGGPGVYNGRLVGVTNFVIGSCGTTAPDGYANVAYFNNWLRANSDL